MTESYRKPLPKGPDRKNRRHGDIVKLAAEISGRSESMVYQVRNGKKKSAIVLSAIHKAETLLRGKGQAA